MQAQNALRMEHSAQDRSNFVTIALVLSGFLVGIAIATTSRSITRGMSGIGVIKRFPAFILRNPIFRSVVAAMHEVPARVQHVLDSSITASHSSLKAAETARRGVV